MPRPSININRRTGGLGRTGDVETTWSALCMNGVATGSVALNTVYPLNNPNDAIALGLDKAYDTTNHVLVNYHISEFFRMCPNGKLFIMLVAQTVTLTQMADKTTTNGLAKLLRDPLCQGKVRQAAIARNPVTGYSPTNADGIDNDCLLLDTGVYSGAVVNAQALAEEERVNHRPVHTFVEGRLAVGLTADLIDATLAACPKVQLVALADNDVSTANAIYAHHAAVGTVLGHRANINLGQSIAYVAIGDIQDASIPAFVKPGLSTGTLLSAFTGTASGDQDVLYDKGFLIPSTEQGYDGVFINGDRTCTATSDDYARGALNMVMNEAERLVYLAMVPNIEADVLVDSAGRLAPIVVQAWQNDCDAKLSTLTGNANDNSGDVSSASSLIDPNQNVLSTDTIVVQVAVVPKGYAKTITVYVGFKNPFNNN